MTLGDDQPISPRDRDYPAWGYLLFGAVCSGGGVLWVMLAGLDADGYRPYFPVVLAVIGLAFVGKGVQEWVRTGSPTARRHKSDAERRESDAERREDAERADRAIGDQWRRFLAGLAVLAVVLVYALVKSIID